MIDILKDLSNFLFIGINALMGWVVTWHDLNQAAALLGIIVTILANSDKMLVSVLRWRDIARAGWRIPPHAPPQHTPNKTPEGEKEAKP